MTRIEELRAEAEAEEAKAKSTALTEDEAEEAALVARASAAKEVMAAASKARRVLALAAKVRSAKALQGPRVLVKGIDLVDLFPAGESPDPDTMPGKGTIVVRSPAPEAMKKMHAEAEHKVRPVADILTDLLCGSTIDPDASSDMAAGALLRCFCEAYPGAALGAAGHVTELGGSKAAADKRGK